LASNKNFNTGKLFFLLSIALFLFWLSGRVIDIYHFAFVGAIFELLWLPMLSLLVALPVVSTIFWVKEKFSVRSFYFYSLLMFLVTLLFLIFNK